IRPEAHAVCQADRLVPASAGFTRQDACQHHGVAMPDRASGAAACRRQADGRACRARKGVRHGQMPGDGGVGAGAARRQRHRCRLQGGAVLCRLRGALLLRRHVSDAKFDRRQSHHWLGRLRVRRKPLGARRSRPVLPNGVRPKISKAGQDVRRIVMGSPGIALVEKATAAALNLANVSYEKKNGIAYVTVNRPKVLNALNTPTWKDLRTAFEDVRDDASVRGAILTGAGNKAFIAGADISELAHVAAFEAEESSRFGQEVLDFIENLGKPVIAAVNGFALGGCCETAMACTIRIAVETAKFGQPEVPLGLIPGGGGTQRLPRLVGRGRALQLILSGEMISAQEAHRIGLVNEIVPAAGLIARAEAILKKIGSNAPIAVKFALEAANKGMDTSQGEGLLLEASYFGLCAATEDKKEGTAAFLEKRAPQFQGR